MRRITLHGLMITTFLFSIGQAQTTDSSNWSTDGQAGALFSQLAMENWAAGGEDAVSLTGSANFTARYARGPVNWDNALHLAYGFSRQGSDPTRKSDDRLEVTSKYGHARSAYWFYSVAASFKTQFSAGYKLPDDSTIVSQFMAPGYLTLSLGMDYKQGKNFSAMISPVSGKLTFVQNQDLADAGAFGVTQAEYDSAGVRITAGETLRAEFGASANLVWRKKVMENIHLSTSLGLFSNYLEKPQNIDVSWELDLNLKVNDYVSATLNAQFVYDDDTRFPNDAGVMIAKPQFKEVIGLGLTYQFF